MRGLTLVTGATGLIGRAVAAEWRTQGRPVRALVRTARPMLPGVELAVAPDIQDRPALRPALEGVETVIHLAARAHVMQDTARDPLAEFRAVNVEGTRALLEEAILAGVRRFCLTSTVKVLGEANLAPWTDATPPAPAGPYAQSKLEAERLVRALAAPAGMQALILRLPLVYGPGMKGNMLRLFDLVQRGIPLPFGRIENRRSLAYVGNVVEAIRAALDSEAAAGETLLMSDGADLSTPDLVRAIGRALGRPVHLVPVPVGLFRALGKIGDSLRRITPAPLGSAAVARLVGSLTVDPSRLMALTGYRPRFTVAEGLAVAADWYRARVTA